MGIFQRIKLVLSSNINHMISKSENPEKILEQLVIDMREQLGEAKKEVAVAIADEKRLEKQLANEKLLALDWEKKAMLAVRNGRDDLAREALTRKTSHDTNVAGFQQSFDSQHNAVEQLRTALRQLADKIEEAQRKKNMLIARAKRAEAQKRIHNTMSGLSDTSAFATFDRMTQKVDQIEAEAEASAELSNELTGQSLQDEFTQLEAHGEADMALAELKMKMGLLPSSAGPDAAGPGDDIEAQLRAMKEQQ
ncbi:MAG: PspA/IM30 family protein [Actinobacteria bacterium]|nr:PspA/IM30 family protein [Actinomycetota bacterium]